MGVREELQQCTWDAAVSLFLLDIASADALPALRNCMCVQAREGLASVIQHTLRSLEPVCPLTLSVQGA